MGEEAMDEPEPFEEWPREKIEFVGDDKLTDVVDEEVWVGGSGGCTVE